MTSTPPPDLYSFLQPRRKRLTRDLILCLIVIVLFVAHIALILGQTCPYWSICFPFTPLAPFVWPPVAIILAVVQLCTVLLGKSPTDPARWSRIVIALLLIAFAADTLTGGDYRWFTIAMRRQLRQCGGAAPLQAWVQATLANPARVAYFESNGIDRKDLPPQFQSFAADFGPFYSSGSDGTWIEFQTGGLDAGWGIVVSNTNLTYPFKGGGRISEPRTWIKQLQPGVYLFAFE